MITWWQTEQLENSLEAIKNYEYFFIIPEIIKQGNPESERNASCSLVYADPSFWCLDRWKYVSVGVGIGHETGKETLKEEREVLRKGE